MLFLTANVASASRIELRAVVSDRVLEVYLDGRLHETYEVAVGKPKNPTPTGSFKVEKLIWNPSWVPPPNAEWAKGKEAKKPGDPGNPMRVAKIFFKQPDYYIHGTLDTTSIGDAKSHGCIRMNPWDVAALGRLMMQYGGKTKPESWFDEVIEGDRTEVVTLDEPIRMRVVD